jgi:hypothetical protein
VRTQAGLPGTERGVAGGRQHRAPEQIRPRRPGASAGGLRGDIGEGARFVLRDLYLRPMTLWAATVNFGLTECTALVVLFLVRVVHVGAGTVGLLTASSGVEPSPDR